jgi:hypothetical protein
VLGRRDAEPAASPSIDILIRSAVDFVENPGITEVKRLQVMGCEHLRLVRNPLLSDVPNVAVYGGHSFVLVVEEGKIKLVCWDCVNRSMKSLVT